MMLLHSAREWLSSLYSKDNLAKLPSFSKKTNILLLACIILVFFFHFLLYINEYHNPHFDDVTYFNYVEKMTKEGGIPNFIENYIDGVMGYSWTSLFTLLLMPFYEQSYTFFAYGNYINFLFGILMIIGVYYSGRKLFNSDFIGISAALLISLNFTVIVQSAVLATENMLILFSILSFLYFIKGIDNSKYWVLAFILGILAYASKASGLLTIISYLIVILFVWKKLPYKYLNLIIATLSLASAIYIFYFLILGHSTSIFLWKNAGIYNSEYAGYLVYEHYSSIFDFISDDPKEFIRRITWGITSNLHRYGISLAFSIEWRYADLFIISTGMFLVPLFFYLISCDPNWKRKYLFFIFSLILFLSLIPRASVSHNVARYSVVAIPIFYFYLSPILFHFYLLIKRKLQNKLNISLKSIFVTILISAVTINSVICFDNFSHFSLFPKFEEGYQKSLDWLKKNTKEEDIIAFESNSRLKFAWYFDHPVRSVMSTSTIGGKYIENKELIDYFKKKKVRYIIVDTWAKHTATNKSTYFFASFIEKRNKSLYIKKEKLPKDLRVVFEDASPPKRIIIFELN